MESIFFLIAISVSLVVALLLRSGRIREATAYSFKKAIFSSLRDIAIAVVAVMIAMVMFSEDQETVIGIGGFVVAYLVAGFIMSMFFEYQKKRGGGNSS